MSVTVVTGPPCSGKTTWVLEQAAAEDIVIDFDRLAVALAGPGADSHQHSKALRDIAFRARAGAITAALVLAQSGHTVWLIHTQPNEAALKRYTEAGARLVTLDPGRDVVEARARAERGPGTLAVIGRWYAEQAKQQAREGSPVVTEAPEQSVRTPTSRAW